jgi:hypothetical protein
MFRRAFWNETSMPHAIIRGQNGRRHEVDFSHEAVPFRVSQVKSSPYTIDLVPVIEVSRYDDV